MLKITLEQWRMFQSVVEHGGFNQASAAIYKSQSSIHSAVQKIEETLGVKLFRIEGRKAKLTQAGEMLLHRSNYLLTEAAKVEAVGRTLGEGIESQLKIAVDEIFPQKLLYKVLDSISSRYPMLCIHLKESILAGASELLENTDVDIAVSRFALRSGFSKELCLIEFIAVAHPEHALHALERELSLEDLKTYRQIVVSDSALSNPQDEGWLDADQRWTVSHMRTSVNMISQGFGFAWLPVSSMEAELKQGRLKPLKLKYNSRRTAQLHLTYTDADRLGPAAKTFVIELSRQCQGLSKLPDP